MRLGFAVRTLDMAATAARLGLDPTPGSRSRPDGVVLTWQLAGVPEGAEARTLPFFIAWGESTPQPGSVSVVHDAGDVTLERLELEADQGRLTALLGGAPLPIHVSPGRRGVTAVALRTGAGAVTLTP